MAMAAQPPQSPREQRPFMVGERVEVKMRRRMNGLGDSWFPATVSEVVDGQNYGVVLDGEKVPGKKLRVSLDKIRPAAAAAEHFPPETELQPRAAVEAFCQGAWSKGEVVRRADEGNPGKYLVMVGSKKRRTTQQPETMELKDLRPPPSCQRKRTNDEDNLNFDEVSHHQVSALVPLGLEPASHENNAMNTFVPENPVNQHSSDNVSGKINHGSTGKIVTHRSRKKTGFKELCGPHSTLDATIVQQEETTLDQMPSFDSLVQSMMTSHIDDSEASFEEKNNILSEVRANVEFTQSLQNRLSEVKSEYTKLEEEEEAVEAQKKVNRNSKSQLDTMQAENDEAVAEHEQKLGYLRLKGQKIEKVREVNDSEFKRLEEVGSRIKKARNDCKKRFRSTLAELKPMMRKRRV